MKQSPRAAWRRTPRRTGRGAWRTIGGLLAALAAGSVAGCGGGSPASHLMPPIAVAGAYIPQPTTSGATVGYLDIRNNGATDRLLSVRISTGGHVSFLVPDGVRDGMQVMKTVSAITIPAHSTVRLNPTGMRLRITDAGSLQGGKDVIVTLRFAHAGVVTVPALVTDPDTGGGSYLLG